MEDQRLDPDSIWTPIRFPTQIESNWFDHHSDETGIESVDRENVKYKWIIYVNLRIIIHHIFYMSKSCQIRIAMTTIAQKENDSDIERL